LLLKVLLLLIVLGLFERRGAEVGHQLFELVQSDRVGQFWFAKHPHETSFLDLLQFWHSNLVATGQEVVRSHNLYIPLILELFEQLDHIFAPESATHCQLLLLEALSNHVKDVLRDVEHLLFRDLHLAFFVFKAADVNLVALLLLIILLVRVVIVVTTFFVMLLLLFLYFS